jgi:hypothetical protein
MAEANWTKREGEQVFIASGALSQGMLVVPHSTAGQVVAAPATGPVLMRCITDAATTTEVTVEPVQRGTQVRLLASNTITAGAEVEFDVSANIGKVKAYSSGTKVGRAQEAAAAGGLVLVSVY